MGKRNSLFILCFVFRKVYIFMFFSVTFTRSYYLLVIIFIHRLVVVIYDSVKIDFSHHYTAHYTDRHSIISCQKINYSCSVSERFHSIYLRFYQTNTDIYSLRKLYNLIPTNLKFYQKNCV